MTRQRSQRGPATRAGVDADHGEATPSGGDEQAGGAEPHDADPSFEASAERLASIVTQLETGELPLEDSLKLFEEGVRVARAAQQRLDLAERRVDELLGVDEHGEPVTRQLEEQEE